MKELKDLVMFLRSDPRDEVSVRAALEEFVLRLFRRVSFEGIDCIDVMGGDLFREVEQYAAFNSRHGRMVAEWAECLRTIQDAFKKKQRFDRMKERLNEPAVRKAFKALFFEEKQSVRFNREESADLIRTIAHLSQHFVRLWYADEDSVYYYLSEEGLEFARMYEKEINE